MNIAVAIDGPVGAGKSSIARQAAKKLDFIYVDTGAMYRGIGLYTVRKGVGTKDTGAVISLLPEIELDIKIIDGTQRVFLNGEDVSENIRLPEISMAASDVSAIPEVRAFLLDLQRGFAKTNNVIMDGRDIGTVILPDAEVKIYLTADAEVRAKRRYDELIAKGKDVKYEDVLADLNQRDYNDMHREIAPLKQADDAIVADTTGFEPEQSLQLLLKIVNEGLNK